MRRRLSVLTSALAVVCLDIEDSVLELQGPPIKADTSPKSAEIFLVHGHDVALKAEVELFLERVTGRQPIVLRNQANGGLTLIEKFEKHGGKAGFAVILMTGDDAGGKAAAGAQALRPRARQNVVFEFGYFVGLVGRGRVAVLVDKGVEEPTDLSGIVYIPTTDWKIDLVRELELAKVPVDRQRM